MADFATLEIAIRRNTVLAASTCLVLLVVTATSMAFTFAALGNARDISLRMPVMVVPGAIGGVYTPGVTEDNLRATARYLAGLVTNFSGIASFQQRFDELETFAAAPFVPALQRARTELQHNVETQNQSRSFIETTGTEQMQQTESGSFAYSVRGQRVVYASGIPMETRLSEVHLRLHLGSPSRRNPIGVLLDGFEVRDLPAPSGSAAPGNATAAQ